MKESTYETQAAATSGDDSLGQAIGWATDLSVKSGPALLAGKFATFGVVSMTRGRYEGSPKLAPSPMAVLTLRVCDSEGKEADIERRVILNSKLLWQIADLMRCVGLLGENDSTIPADSWDRLVGRKGVCELVTRESSRGTRYSSVERFLHGDEALEALSELGHREGVAHDDDKHTCDHGMKD